MKPRQQLLSPLQQLLWLKKLDANGDGGVGRDALEWKTFVRASPVSRVYKVIITQKIGRHPRTRVLGPSLKLLAEGKRIPHLYDQEREVLCLYFPPASEFDGTKPIATQILPWIGMWLYYFEEWLVSGEWAGGGIHNVTVREPRGDHAVVG